MICMVAGPSMSPTEQWVYISEKIDRLSDAMSEKVDGIQKQSQSDRHQMRDAMQAGFGKVQADIASLRADLTGTDRKVLVMETERRMESASITRKAGWIALVVTLGGGFVLRLLEKWLTTK